MTRIAHNRPTFTQHSQSTQPPGHPGCSNRRVSHSHSRTVQETRRASKISLDRQWDRFSSFIWSQGVDPRFRTAEYYWFVFYTDEDLVIKGSDHWLITATPAERLQFIRKFLLEKSCHPTFRDIVDHQKEERMIPSFLIRDMVPYPCPDGPVTLVGDAAHPMGFCKSRSFQIAIIKS
jgi:2-polyprenyl-6-methoxyphenol hydroxylase-like FAD-dependent oxidoreductase